MDAMFLLSIFDGLTPEKLAEAVALTILIGGSPILLHGIFYIFYAGGHTIYNAIRVWLGKPLEDIIGIDEFGLLGVIERARRKQEIEKENEQKIEQEKNRATVCEMLNSRTEVVSSTFERYGLILSSIRIHPYDDDEYACDLIVESREGTELTDDVYIHVLLFDDNDYETNRLDITIWAYGFSGYLVNNNEEFSISSDAVPTHMEVYVDKNR